MMKKAIPLLIITTLLFVFTSCENKALDYYKITFDSDGGNYTPEEQYVKNGGKVIEPKAPTKGEAVFSSWTLDGSEYNFSTPVKSDITLKATYTSVYTVTFNSDGGTYTPEVQYIKAGDKVIEPKSPDKGSTRGFMWWVDKDGTPYDFSKAVTSSFSLKAVYWPSNVLSGSKDPSTYDEKINEIYHETKCLYNIVTSFISLENLMSGEKDIQTIFSVKDKDNAGDTIRAIVANAKMDENHITINGERMKLENTGTIIHLSEDKYKTIESNKSSIKDCGTSGVYTKKYVIDISNMAFSTEFYKSWVNKRETIETTISLKGTVIKYDGDRMEMHVQFTIDGKEYPILHASTFDTTGGSEEITVSYKGYNGYFFIKDL